MANECITCTEMDGLEGECPDSKRSCGHHCNCSWLPDRCHWCGAQWHEETNNFIRAAEDIRAAANSEVHEL